MVLVTVYFHSTSKLLYLSIYAYVEITFATHLLKEFTVVTFTIADEWREDVYFTVLIVRHNHIHHFLLCIFHHLFTTHIRVCLACTSKEKSEIIVYLSSCSDGRTWILIGRFLFNGDDGRESCNLIYIRTLHISEEVACVCRESLNVSTLTFGENSIESKRTLS